MRKKDAALDRFRCETTFLRNQSLSELDKIELELKTALERYVTLWPRLTSWRAIGKEGFVCPDAVEKQNAKRFAASGIQESYTARRDDVKASRPTTGGESGTASAIGRLEREHGRPVQSGQAAPAVAEH